MEAENVMLMLCAFDRCGRSPLSAG
jgi:hypothetical protein